jgi:hypothetical protein
LLELMKKEFQYQSQNKLKDYLKYQNQNYDDETNNITKRT